MNKYVVFYYQTRTNKQGKTYPSTKQVGFENIKQAQRYIEEQKLDKYRIFRLIEYVTGRYSHRIIWSDKE